MIKSKKKYQLWVRNGCEGWTYEAFDTIEECLYYPKYGQDFMITKAVDFEIKEKDERNK